MAKIAFSGAEGSVKFIEVQRNARMAGLLLIMTTHTGWFTLLLLWWLAVRPASRILRPRPGERARDR